MARSAKKKVPAISQPRSRRAANEDTIYDDLPVPYHPKRSTTPLVAQNNKQQRYINAIKNFDVTFGLGPAGTGKSYCATVIAADMLATGTIEKIIVTRPAVEAEEEFGFLPGELTEKYEPYLIPIREILNERLGKGATEYYIKSGKIEAVPLGFMRGRSFKNAFIIFDEAQNATVNQMKLFLTRIGQDCKVVIDGDESQTDISNSGLADAARRIAHIPCVKVVQFDRSDIVRSGFVAEVLDSYSKQ